MHLERLHRRLAELDEIGVVQLEGVDGCSEAELAALEKKRSVRLPGVVRELYLWGGKESEVFDEDEVVGYDYQMKTDLHASARDIIIQAGEDPTVLRHALIMQMDYDGQFSFVKTDQGEDPVVWTRTESRPAFPSCERYSDYLLLMVEQKAGIEEIELADSLEMLEGLAARSTHKVRHLLISPELRFLVVPEVIFNLRELKSLNMVGKGLLELPPRIQEFPFLQTLVLAKNSLASLPMALKELDELQDLDVSENQLSTVLGVLRNLPALRYCDLRGNPIPADEIAQIQEEFPELQLKCDSTTVE